METPETKRFLSLIKPTGMPTLGNYLGALKYWAEPQDEFECIYGVADLHAITVKTTPADLRKETLNVYALLLTVGIDPEKSIVFIQSHVRAHAELAWILGCHTSFGELSRMTQFKDKTAKGEEGITAGLFTYPALMAADILIYNAHAVPVGEDQKQHVELTRTIAERMNFHYNGLFTLPEAYVPKTGARIKSLKNPLVKMSKSDIDNSGCIGILDSRDDIIRKFKRAVTDSDSEVRFAEGKDGINNLLNIYCGVTDKTMAEAERAFSGVGYGAFKLAVGEAVADCLEPLKIRFDGFISDKAELERIYRDGDDRAAVLAERTLRKVKKKVGFLA